MVYVLMCVRMSDCHKGGLVKTLQAKIGDGLTIEAWVPLLYIHHVVVLN